MAMQHCIGVSAVTREIKEPYQGVSAVARKITEEYQGVSGVARQYWKVGTPLSSLAVGSTVYMKVNGVSKAFLVVNQGRPSTVYNTSCNGTWLLMKDLYESRAWDSSNNDYANSDIHSYLNNTFVNLFDSDIKSVIKQVKLPYTQGTGSGGSLKTGSNGLSAKVFLLSYAEVMATTHSCANAEGAALSHFNGAAAADRIAYLNGSAANWWLRSPDTDTTDGVWRVRSTGSDGRYSVTNSHGIRPALILPSSAKIDENNNILG